MLLKHILLVVLAVLVMATPSAAIEVEVSHQDRPTCDPLFVPQLVDELGLMFPPDELITAEDFVTEMVACPSTDSPNIPNVVVEMRNLTTRSFSDVWYVSDPETMISNTDGLVNNEKAFRIDSMISNPGGANLPLIFESIAANDIFQPGEIWQFIIDDYANLLNLPPSALASPGLVGALSGMDSMSSGSIIAVPEPGTCGMLVLGLAWMIASVGRHGKRLLE